MSPIARGLEPLIDKHRIPRKILDKPISRRRNPCSWISIVRTGVGCGCGVYARLPKEHIGKHKPVKTKRLTAEFRYRG